MKRYVDIYECLRNPITDITTLSCIRERVDELISFYGEDATLEFSSGCENISEYISYRRLETDYEYKKRLAEEESKTKSAAKKQASLEKSERKEYERLKKKYG